MKRIVIKVGSNVLTRDNGKLDVTRMSAIVDQIAWLRRHDYEVILVSSGAVACGRGELKTACGDGLSDNGSQASHHRGKTGNKLDSVEQRQLYSALGQVKLIGLYYDLFREYGIHIGQVLTMKENFEPGEQYENQRACMSVMLDNGVLPIINENDTVSVTELMFTDNDELSGLIAQMMSADEMILLTNVDGVYNGKPDNPHSRVIPSVYWNRDVKDYIIDEKSEMGRGGMLTKSNIAHQVANAGIRVVIANGNRDNILIDLIQRPMEIMHTEFVPKPI